MLNFPVVLRRRGTYSVTVQKAVEIPQLQLLDKLMISIVVQRLVPGRDSADNCGGVAVAWTPVEIPQVQFLDKLDTPFMHARCRVFFDKVVDVPVVLCNGVPQVQFIDGYGVPVIMRGQRSAPHLAD